MEISRICFFSLSRFPPREHSLQSQFIYYTPVSNALPPSEEMYEFSSTQFRTDWSMIRTPGGTVWDDNPPTRLKVNQCQCLALLRWHYKFKWYLHPPAWCITINIQFLEIWNTRIIQDICSRYVTYFRTASTLNIIHEGKAHWNDGEIFPPKKQDNERLMRSMYSCCKKWRVAINKPRANHTRGFSINLPSSLINDQIDRC